MPPKPQIQLEQFIQKYATEFYLTEEKRKHFIIRFVPTVAISSVLTIGIFITALFFIKNAALAFLTYLAIIPVLLIGLILSIYFWVRFQKSYKKLILQLLIKEYFPSLHYNQNGLNSKHADLIEKIGYQKEYKKFHLRTEDLIYGAVGRLYIRLFEAKIESSKNQAGKLYKFKGIILEIQNISAAVQWTDLFEEEALMNAYEQIFTQHKTSPSPLFCSPNGNWYIFLEHHRGDYLEPKKFKKSFNQEDLSKIVYDFYYFIKFVEILNKTLYI